jgi:hypothetical protein
VVIAEKLHAMVVLDIRNSRMKDFYDIWFLARTKGFDLAPWPRAIMAMFERRRTPISVALPFCAQSRIPRRRRKGSAMVRGSFRAPTRSGDTCARRGGQ